MFLVATVVTMMLELLIIAGLVPAIFAGYKNDILEQHAAHMESLMDVNVNPCEDFWNYSKGRLAEVASRNQHVNLLAKVLPTYNPKHVNTSLQLVKDHYKACKANPISFFSSLQVPYEPQKTEILHFIDKTRRIADVQDDGRFLALLQQAYRLLFKYGSNEYHQLIQALIGMNRVLLPFVLLGQRRPQIQASVVQIHTLTSADEFIYGVFGEKLDISTLESALIAFPMKIEDRQTLLEDLSLALWQTLTIPYYPHCESYILNNFDVYYAKLHFDYLGNEYITGVEQQYRADSKLLIKTVENSFMFGNVLSKDMTDMMLERVKMNKFYGIKNPVLEDEEFYKHFNNLTLLTPVQNRLINNIRPLFRAVFGKNVGYYYLPKPSYNAFHLSYKHRTFVNFPILNPPLYHTTFSPLLRFSGAGFVVGHELGHDFDPGMQDSLPLDKTYTQIFECIIEFFKSQCDPQRPDFCGDPKNNIHENFADVFGAQMAYITYKADVALNGVGERPRGTILDSLTDDQLFFLNLAQTNSMFAPAWSGLADIVDVHSAGPVRVWGSLAGLPAFANAFKCPAGSNYNRSDGCKLYNDKIQPDYNLTDPIM